MFRDWSWFLVLHHQTFPLLPVKLYIIHGNLCLFLRISRHSIFISLSSTLLSMILLFNPFINAHLSTLTMMPKFYQRFFNRSCNDVHIFPAPKSWKILSQFSLKFSTSTSVRNKIDFLAILAWAWNTLTHGHNIL